MQAPVLSREARHPCFDGCAGTRYGRVHLPVAPQCNIQCNYCNRSYDCVNESRPGVTSFLLEPAEVLGYLGQVFKVEPRITVVGIAGPGDPMCDPERTLTTLRLIRAAYPEVLLCLSSNGLNVAEHVEDLAEIRVRHMTITVNAVDPGIGSRIYKWVRFGSSFYLGREGAELLLARQLEAIERIKRAGIILKVNTVVIPGVNDRHVDSIAQWLAALDVDLMNCIPLLPVVDTPFAHLASINRMEINVIRNRAERHLVQMRHCVRCRADAVGMLNQDPYSAVQMSPSSTGIPRKSPASPHLP